MSDAYVSPEEAARGDVPERFARAVAVSTSPEGNDAVELLLTNEQPHVEPYEVICHQDEAGWTAGAGSNGMGWKSCGDTGVDTLWDRVSEDVVEVVVTWGAEDHRVPVQDGYFHFTRWNTPYEHSLESIAYVSEHVRVDGSVTQIDTPDLEDMKQQRRRLAALLRESRLGQGIYRIELRRDDPA